MYFNSNLAFVLNRHLTIDIRRLVQGNDRFRNPYRLIRESDDDHLNNHTDIPFDRSMHHHYKHNSTIQIEDILHIMEMHQKLFDKRIKNNNEYCFISNENLSNLKDAFEYFQKFSHITKSPFFLTIHLKIRLNDEAYLPRLEHVINDKDSKTIIHVNNNKTTYYIPLFWLKS